MRRSSMKRKSTLSTAHRAALSDQCGLAITSLTSMLERMEKQGLLRRESDEKDKRKTLLFLTDRAYALREDYEAVSAQMGAVFYEGFSEEEIRLFESFLRRVLDNLEGGQRP